LTCAVGKVVGIVQSLDISHHLLIGEGLGPVLLGDLDVAFARHEVPNIDRGNLETFDRVGGRYGVRGEELS
jgi:hypothetical protein